ncbi:NnrS family protein [Ramlibacter tataouinensis]|uniref:Short-chain dehydrogenase n=1 Tax=Ramlibacter tataouinensis TaxID=94132 RepID=A0A127JXD2_9BURK|nr:NnrS family protein [Ramlibacter tataouinensis]AMO24533.1 short-chain dehydrogenase [Ramlibacter tataouinensis]
MKQSPIPTRTVPIQPPPPGLPLLRLGFRPFYLGAALFAMLAVPLWAGLWLGHVPLDLHIAPMLWHGHEMLFGFAVAVIVGFLLTAGKAWTGLPTPRGPALGALAALWLAARLAAVAAPYPVYAALDVALLPAVAVAFGAVLLRSRNFRNLPIAGILLGLALANLCFHLAALGIVPLSPLSPLHAALGFVVVIETVIGGRVIPSFTANATPGLRIPPRPRLDWTALAVTALALLLWVFAPAGVFGAIAFFAAAGLQLARQWHWRPLVTRDRPILWILHLSYAWLAVGFALLGAAQAGWTSESLGVHALAVGATGGLIIGMITRTARGHTGRPLTVGRAEVLAYLLVMTAAVLRVLLPLVAPQWVVGAVAAAALAWSAAFAIYLFIYTPWLASTRVDGKDG